jgi:uncharacterized protein
VAKDKPTLSLKYCPLQEDVGFYKLPEPSEHDIFFDFEGDPFAGETGIEYLFGWYYLGNYYDLWAHNDAEELHALNKFMDTVMDIWKQDEKNAYLSFWCL